MCMIPLIYTRMHFEPNHVPYIGVQRHMHVQKYVYISAQRTNIYIFCCSMALRCGSLWAQKLRDKST